jgi:uncharacterized protein (TIGR02391 family)
MNFRNTNKGRTVKELILGDKTMNLEVLLTENLWKSIQSSYERRDYTASILDAIHFLTSLIREKTGLDGDGVSLVGRAFGGKSPKLKVNNLQTESEKNIQAGVEQLLRGLYSAIRNPRSHQKFTDEQKNADAIIVFINYLLGIIDQSKTPFLKSEFLNRVFDPSFVKKTRYSELLVKEIPSKKRLEVMLDVFLRKETGEGEKIKFFVSALLTKLTELERRELFEVISNEIMTTHSEKTLICSLQIFPPDALIQITEAARMRLESKLLESISKGTYIPELKDCNAGGVFGTWAGIHCAHFLLKDDLLNTLIRKIDSQNSEEHEYLNYFFWYYMIDVFNPPPKELINAFNEKLFMGDKWFYDRLSSEEVFGNSEWVKPFEKKLREFKKTYSTKTFDKIDPFE